MADAIVSQVVVETLVAPAAAGATVSQIVVETLVTNNVIALVSQVVVETLSLNVSGLIQVDGGSRSSSVLKRTVVIRDELNEGANTAVMEVRGSATYAPRHGQGIVISLGSAGNLIFAGYVLSVDHIHTRASQRYPRYRVNCIDYTWEFDWRLIEAKLWSGVSASTIITEIISYFCPNFSYASVQVGMESVTFQSNHEERPSQAITRLMKSIGGFWYIDYNKVVHAFVDAEVDNNPFELNSSNADFWDLEYSADLSQVRTRTRVTGGSSSTTAVVAVGATSIPVDDTRLFGSSGGDALLGANKVAYTGKSVTTGPGNLTGVTGMTYEVAQGESVRVIATAVNASAVTALASLLGSGDGYIEYSIEDGNMGDAAARIAAQADVDLNGSPDAIIRFKTRSLYMYSGKIITADLTNPSTGETIAGTFLVQSVTIHSFAEAADDSLYPIRDVVAGTSKQNLFNLLGKLA